MFNKSTYTFGVLKQNVYKVLDEFSVNGYGVSLASGVVADMEKRFVTAVNMCLRRIMLSFPLLVKETEIVFTEGENGCFANLPEDFGKAEKLTVRSKGEIPASKYRIVDDRIICFNVAQGESAILEYSVKINDFTQEANENDKLNLPDISADALVYLTAAELCPTDYSELFSRRMYKYRDLALNCYNAGQVKKSARNSFYIGTRRLKRW